MALDDDMKKALEEARAVKNALGVQDLPVTSATTDEMRAGSPRSPGFDEHSGKTMKPDPEWPDPPTEPSPSPSPAPVPSAGGGNVFEQALSSKLSELEASEKSRQTPEPGGGMDL